MANEPSQVSVFDDEAMIDAALRNIEIIKRKREVDINSLTEAEKRFLTGIAFMVDMDENPIQPKRLVGKKISPFSKMMMSAADTFSRAKKAFNIWTNKEPALAKEDIQRVGPPAPTLAYKMQRRYIDINNAIGDKITDVNMKLTDSISNGIHNVSSGARNRYNAINNAIGDKLYDINNGINNGVETVINNFNYATNAVGETIGNGVEAVNRKIDNGIENVAVAMSSVGDFLERKKLNITNRFMEIYDDVTVAKMNMQTSLANKVNTTKDKYLEVKTSVSAFAEKFEEPWISISFKGQENIPSLADISYNTGLFASKAKKSFSNALSGLLENLKKNEEDKIEPVAISPSVTMQNNEGVSIIGSKLAEPAVAEPAVAEPVVAEPAVAEPAVAEPVVAEPVVAEPVVAEPVVTEQSVPEPVLAEQSVPEPVLAEQGVYMSKNDDHNNVIMKFKEFQKTGAEKRKVKTENIGFLSSVRSFLGIGGAVKANKEVKYLGYEFDRTQSLKEPSHFFKDLNTGNLPSRVNVFKETENRLKQNLGLAVTETGHYEVVYPNSLIIKDNKVKHIEESIVPHALNELKKSADYIYSLKLKQKEDPVLKVYDALFEKVDDDKKVLEILKNAKNSPDVKKELQSLNIDGMDDFLNNIDSSLLKVEEHRYLMSLADFDMAVVAKAVVAIKLEVVSLSKDNYSILKINEKLDSTEIMENGATVINLLAAVNKNYDAILKADGNEEIMLRGLASNEKDEAKRNFERSEKIRLKDEKRVIDSSSGSLAVDMISGTNNGTSNNFKKISSFDDYSAVDSNQIFEDNKRLNDQNLQEMSDATMASHRRFQGRINGGRMLNPHTPDPRGLYTLHSGDYRIPPAKPPEYTISTADYKPDRVVVSEKDVVGDVSAPVQRQDEITLPSNDIREKHFGARRNLIIPEDKNPKP